MKAELFERREGETLTDWTLRFLVDAMRRRTEAELAEKERQHDLERRRLRDLYHAVTPREAEQE